MGKKISKKTPTKIEEDPLNDDEEDDDLSVNSRGNR